MAAKAKPSADLPSLGGAIGDPDKDWQAEDDHRTMTRAAAIQNDPERMKGVKKHHRKVSKALGTVGRSLNGKR